LPRQPNLTSELVILNGGLCSFPVPESHSNLNAAGATSPRAADVFAGVAGLVMDSAPHVQAETPTLKGRHRDQGREEGRELEALREDVLEMRAQLAQILSALGQCRAGGFSMPVRDSGFA
jgi:hypothetical protein